MVTVFLEIVVAVALTMITLTVGGMLAGQREPPPASIPARWVAEAERTDVLLGWAALALDGPADFHATYVRARERARAVR